METLARFIDRRPPVGPDESCIAVAKRFGAEPDALALPVVRDGRPIGLIARDIFEALNAQSPESIAALTVSAVMDREPLVVDAGASVGDFIDDVLASRPQALGRGIIVVEHGIYAGMAGAAALVAARRARKAEARQTSGLIEELSVGIGRHLHNLISFAERLNRQSLPPDAQAWVRAISETSGELRDLTAYARELHWAQSERMVLRPTPCRLRDLADVIDGRWSRRSDAGQVRVMVSYDGDPGAAALLDIERVAQCFDALIHRAYHLARHHAGAAALIEATLRARTTSSGAVLLEGVVRDSIGGGIEPGQRPSATPTSADLAVRLRMALAARTLLAIGGEFKLDETMAGGSEVAFSFEVATAQVDQAPAPERLQVDDRSVRVLVVDDNATNRMVAESLCGLFGCVTESAADGVAALEAASDRAFDVILMDIRMPRMNGLEATRAIRALPGAAGRTPILALTANADPADIQSYLEAGMQGAVEKPVKAEKLAAALDMALSAAERTSAAVKGAVR
jgi:CheY-like chemotaxis protein